MRLPTGSPLATLNESDDATDDAYKIIASLHLQSLKKTEADGDVENCGALHRRSARDSVETCLLSRRELACAFRDVQCD